MDNFGQVLLPSCGVLYVQILSMQSNSDPADESINLDY